jgi:hypothetical protein
MTIEEILEQYQISESDLRELINKHKGEILLENDFSIESEASSDLVKLLDIEYDKNDKSIQKEGLKIVGKIDLSKFNPPKGKKRERIGKSRSRVEDITQHSSSSKSQEEDEYDDSIDSAQSNPMTKEQEIRAAYEELAEQIEQEEEACWRQLESMEEEFYEQSVFWSEQEYYENEEDKEEEERWAKEEEKKRKEEEALRQKEEAIMERITDIRSRINHPFHLHCIDSSKSIIVDDTDLSLPKGCLYVFQNWEQNTYIPIGLYDLEEGRCFIFDSSHQDSYISMNEMNKTFVYITDAKGQIILPLSIGGYSVFQKLCFQNGWFLLEFNHQDQIILVNNDGECIFVFPKKYSSIRKAEEGTILLPYSSDEVFIVDFSSNRIIQKHGLIKDETVEYHLYTLRYETVYDKSGNIVEKSLFAGQKRLLPRLKYDSFDAFVSSHRLSIIGKYNGQQYDIFQYKYKESSWGGISEEVKNNPGSTFHIESDSVRWIEKQYGLVCKRYPLLQYINRQGETCVIFGDKQVCLPFNRFSIAVVYNGRNSRDARTRWSRSVNRNYWRDKIDVVLEDYGTATSMIDYLVLCGGNQIIYPDGTLYHSFPADTVFVDSWFEYVAFINNKRLCVFEFVEGEYLECLFHISEDQEPRFVSPLLGTITGVLSFTDFEERLWAISYKGSSIVAIDSYGDEHQLRLSRWISMNNRNHLIADVTMNKNDYLVLVLGNGEYALIRKKDAILVEVPCSVYPSDEHQDFLSNETNRYLDIGSRYECFDLEKQVFIPVPWINEVVKEDKDWEFEFGPDYSNDDISMLDALDGDWSNYWNID